MKYPLKFRAAILRKNKQPLSVEEVVFDGPLQAGQVLVKIEYSGICGKQLEEQVGTRPDPYIPHMLGHEGGGVVCDIGPGVKKVVLGDYVVLHWMKGSGINSISPYYLDNDNNHVNAGCITTFNEYGIISENRLTKIPKDTPLDVACLLGCCVPSGVGVIFNEARPLPGDSVAVFGCGGVGLNVIQASAIINAYPIIAVDINQKSLDLAKLFGATHLLESSKTVYQEIRKITLNGKQEIKDAKNFGLEEPGANFVVIATGNAEAIEIAFKSGSIPGKVYLTGVPDYDVNVTLNAFDIHASRDLVGSHGGATVPDRDVEKHIGLYNRSLLKLDELITDKIKFSDVNVGLDLLRAGNPGRYVIDFKNDK